MNRRDFLRLAGLATLGIISPKKAGSMLPNSTNRFGDMLKDVLSGVQGIDQIKVDKLQQEMNDLWMRETKYRSWLRLQDNKIDFKNLALPFEPIYSTVLEDDKSEFVVPIPSKYSHLMIMGQASLVGTGIAAQNIFAQFNGDTGASNYSYQEILAANTTLLGQQDLTYDKISIGVVKADAGTAYYSGSFFSFIPHYRNTNYYKEVLRSIGYYSGAGAQVNNAVFLWKSLDPINSIRFFPDTVTYPSAKIEAGSLISVYGIF